MAHEVPGFLITLLPSPFSLQTGGYMRSEITFGWRMPMWDPAGAPLASWLPNVRRHLDALPVETFQTVWMSDHLVPGAPWAPPQWETLECMTALIHFATAYPGYRYGQI